MKFLNPGDFHFPDLTGAMFEPLPTPQWRTRARAAENAETRRARRPDDRATAAAALDPAPRWLVSAWNVLSVVPASRGGRDDWRIMCSTLLVVSCAYVVYATPDMVCLLQSNCDASLFTFVESMFPRTVAVSCLASRLPVLLAGARTAAYERAVAAYRALRPVTRAEADALRRFACLVALAGALLAVPFNAMRTYTVAASGVSGPVVAAFVLMYAQNLSAMCVEAHFVAQCHALCRMFAAVNRDLAAVRAQETARNRYPATLGARQRYPATGADDDCEDARLPRTAARVRRLRTMHGLATVASVELNRAFGVHVGLSLCAVCVYFMLDVYYRAMGSWADNARWDLMFYGWILQYFYRFAVVTIMAHVTSKQVG